MRGAVALAACAALLPMAPAQRLTTIAVAVERQDGRPVEGLTAADFSLRIDDAPVTIEKVTYISTDLSVAVVLDLTASGFWPGRQPSGSIVPAIADHALALLPEGTAVLTGSVGRSVRWTGDFSPDRSEQKRWLRSAVSLPDAERTGPSPVWDAVDEAVIALQSRQDRRAVLLVTDGQATGNRLGLAEVADRAIAAGVTINVVFTGSSGLVRQTRETAAGVYPDRSLIQLSSATGGSYVARAPRANPEHAPVDALRAAATAMRSAYRLEFAAPVKAGFQRISVTTRNPEHRPRAPMGLKISELQPADDRRLNRPRGMPPSARRSSRWRRNSGARASTRNRHLIDISRPAIK